MTEIGHNHGIAADQLKSIIERYERLQEEVDGLKEDQKGILQEAAGNGFDVKALKEILKIRRADAEKRRELAEIVELYASALGIEL